MTVNLTVKSICESLLSEADIITYVINVIEKIPWRISAGGVSLFVAMVERL